MPRIASPTAALTTCVTAFNLQDLADSLKPLEESVVLALTKAQKDNNAIYLEKV